MIRGPENSIERQEHYPITKGEIFDPEAEIRKIHLLPKEERAESIRSFEEKLSYQKQGIAVIERKILGLIERNHDIGSGELSEEINDDIAKFGFSENQRDLIGQALLSYEKSRIGLKRILSSGKESDVFKTITGADPKGKIEIEDRGLAGVFVCKSLVDSLRIMICSYLSFVSDDAVLRAKEVGYSNLPRAMAFSVKSSLPDENGNYRDYKYNIAVINSSLIEDDIKRLPPERTQGHTMAMIEEHEISHTKRLIDKSIFDYFLEKIPYPYNNQGESNKAIFLDRIGQISKSEIGALHSEVKSYLRAERLRIGLNRFVKDELLSRLEAQWPVASEEKIISHLVQRDIRRYLTADSCKETIAYLEKIVGEAGGLGWGYELRKDVKLILIDEFEKILLKCFEAVNLLKNNGYIREEIVSILSREPLTKWKKAAERLLAGEKIKTFQDTAVKKEPIWLLRMWGNRFANSKR
ncbi:MAG: hypothetical protein PHU56_02395 [Candidatus Pacebacteria bacterium]|nr:hypothetical protein [Candidatus Paceibacterota bacterium]